jgi:enoyl-CoA hydratase
MSGRITRIACPEGEYVMSQVLVEVRGGIAVLTIDNPPLNVLSRKLGQQLRTELEVLSTDKSVYAVVLTGSGNKAFMAGADIKEFPSYISGDIAEPMALQFDETLQYLHHLSKPTIAALNGLTLGGGCEVALACDFRIAETQIHIGLPEVKLGVFPGAGGTQRLPRLIGESRAKELILLGEPVSAEEAYRLGLVNRLAPPGGAVEAALSFAQPFLSRSQSALALAKQAIHEGGEGTLEEGLHREAHLFAEAFRTHDGREGIQAFIEKRPPNFRHE